MAGEAAQEQARSVRAGDHTLTEEERKAGERTLAIHFDSVTGASAGKCGVKVAGFGTVQRSVG